MPSAVASCKPCSKESSLPERAASRESRTPGALKERALSKVSSGVDSFLASGVTTSSYVGLAGDGGRFSPSPPHRNRPSYQSGADKSKCYAVPEQGRFVLAFKTIRLKQL